MHAVEIRLNPSDLSREMGAMRFWLDEQRVDVSGFSCSHQEDRVLIRVEFARAQEANAFANRFADRTTTRRAADPPERLALTPGLSSSSLVG